MSLRGLIQTFFILMVRNKNGWVYLCQQTGFNELGRERQRMELPRLASISGHSRLIPFHLTAPEPAQEGLCGAEWNCIG